MKVKPVVDSLERRGARVHIVHTGQHYCDSMSAVFFEELGLRPPDHFLGVGSGTHGEQTAGVILALEPVVHDLKPDVVVVVGDVNSTLAAALVAAKACVPVAHVEAGLRSGDWTMPEEVNRVVTDRVSTHLFAPSADAVDNLLGEGVARTRIHLVGNVMIDTLLSNLDRACRRDVLRDLGLRPHEYGLVTLHRPGNVDDPTTLRTLVDALRAVSARCPLVFPAHPRTKARLDAMSRLHDLCVIDPLGYLDFVALEASARLVLTDSGGVQEETTVLGVPCLTLRETTERPITVTEGTNTVVGRDPATIEATVRRVLSDGVPPRRPALWDGHAGERIAEVLVGGG
jgi:UDP-N-acetylglucosamine 2-epimerase (non-hydrolysing)